MIDIASKQIIPAVIKYTKSLADTVNSVTAAGAEASVQSELLAETSGLLSDTKVALQKLMDLDKKSEEVPEGTDIERRHLFAVSHKGKYYISEFTVNGNGHDFANWKRRAVPLSGICTDKGNSKKSGIKNSF